MKSTNTSTCGVDEAGRGPLAGPVYAAAVMLPAQHKLPGLDDSKRLRPQQRQDLFQQIIEVALDYHIATSSVEEIDTLNILQASLLAMHRAVHRLQQPAEPILVDGKHLPKWPYQAHAIVRGDQLHASIAAASILAKVARDRAMLQCHKAYPDYGFDQHKGYPTALHLTRLAQFGPCPIHRQSFKPVKKYANVNNR